MLDDDLSTFEAFVDAYHPLLRQIERAYATGGLPAGEVRILLALGKDSPSPSELGRSQAMDSGQITRHLNALDKKKLIIRERRTPGAPGRVSLSESGKQAASDARIRRDRELRSLFARLSKAEKERFFHACERAGHQLEREGSFNEIRLRAGKLGDEGVIIAAFSQNWVGGSRPLGRGYLREVVAALTPHMTMSPTNTIDFIVAERAGRLVGAALLDRPEGAGASINLLFIYPYAIEAGLEQRLIEECEKRAERRGYPRIGMRVPNRYLGELEFGRRYLEPQGWGMTNDLTAPEYGPDIKLQNWGRQIS